MEAPKTLIDLFKYCKIWQAKNSPTFVNPIRKYDEFSVLNGESYHVLCEITEEDVIAFNTPNY